MLQRADIGVVTVHWIEVGTFDIQCIDQFCTNLQAKDILPNNKPHREQAFLFLITRHCAPSPG